MNIKIEQNFFSHNKLNFQPRTLKVCSVELFCPVLMK